MKSMKVCLFILALVFPSLAFADANGVKITEVKGEIVSAVWRSGYSYTRIEKTDEVPIETNISVGDHWYLVLKNLEGLKGDLREQISLSFIQGEPSAPMSHMADPKNHLFIRISGDKKLNLASGNRILLKDCFFRMDKFGGGFSYKDLKIGE